MRKIGSENMKDNLKGVLEMEISTAFNLLYKVLDGMVSDEGRNKLLEHYCNYASPDDVSRLGKQLIDARKFHEIRLFRQRDCPSSLSVFKRNYLALRKGRLQNMETLIAETGVLSAERAKEIIELRRKISLDEVLVKLEVSGQYEGAVNLLLEHGEVERAKLYQAAKIIAEDKVPWYAD